MLSLDNVFHTGFIVAELEPAMAELTTVFGITWTAIEDRRLAVVTPDGPLRARQRFVYSRGEPPLIELLEPVAGTVWDQPTLEGSGPGAAHHVGVWAEDFAATSERLVGAGFPRLLTFDDGSGRAVGFAYHRLPSGALVEIVDAAVRADLEAWFRGGEYPAAPSSAALTRRRAR